MIRFAVVHRAKDGLALSASTDMDNGVELRESKRYAKLVSRKSRQFPVRSWMAVGRFRIFFFTESDVCFLLISESTFAPVLAYSFLDDLKREFLSKYTRGAVNKAVRPYSFIEFDAYIQKTKQKYNNTRTLYTRIDLSSISEELKTNSPFEVSERDLGQSGIVPNGITKTTSSLPSPVRKLSPLTTLASISLALSGVCTVLNIIRLIPFISEHTDNVNDESPWMWISFCFFLSATVSLFQCYVLLYPVRQRLLINATCFAVGMWLLYCLYDLRNLIQIAFHFISSGLITFNTWNRPLLGKLPNYNV